MYPMDSLLYNRLPFASWFSHGGRSLISGSRTLTMKSQGNLECRMRRGTRWRRWLLWDSLITSKEKERKFRRVVPNRISVKHFKFAWMKREWTEPCKANQKSRNFNLQPQRVHFPEWQELLKQAFMEQRKICHTRHRQQFTHAPLTPHYEVPCTGFILQLIGKERSPRWLDNILYRRLRQSPSGPVLHRPSLC